jgi:mRNA-degrading endonuclease toxin of MazEF toxin-antitoxin module
VLLFQSIDAFEEDLEPPQELAAMTGANEGLKHDSAVHCDELVSLQKSMLTDYSGSLSDAQMQLGEMLAKLLTNN